MTPNPVEGKEIEYAWLAPLLNQPGSNYPTKLLIYISFFTFILTERNVSGKHLGSL